MTCPRMGALGLQVIGLRIHFEGRADRMNVHYEGKKTQDGTKVLPEQPKNEVALTKFGKTVQNEKSVMEIKSSVLNVLHLGCC